MEKEYAEYRLKSETALSDAQKEISRLTEHNRELSGIQEDCARLTALLDAAKFQADSESGRVSALLAFLVGARNLHEERDKELKALEKERLSLFSRLKELEARSDSCHIIELEVKTLKEQLLGYQSLLDRIVSESEKLRLPSPDAADPRFLRLEQWHATEVRFHRELEEVKSRVTLDLNEELSAMRATFEERENRAVESATKANWALGNLHGYADAARRISHARFPNKQVDDWLNVMIRAMNDPDSILFANMLKEYKAALEEPRPLLESALFSSDEDWDE